MFRVSFNSTPTIDGAYRVPLNPSDADLHGSDNYTTLKIIDGAPVKQEAYFDDRPFSLKWYRIPSNLSGFATMLTTLSGYKNSKKYVNFGDIDYRVSGTAWEYVRVMDLKVDVEKGGKLKYNVELVLIKEVV